MSAVRWLSALAFLPVLVVPAAAQETGLDVIHSQVRRGGKLCFTDHFHTIGGSGPSKRAAERAAIGTWQSFTGLEYGDSWGRWANASHKSMKCSGSGSNWSCEANGIPCRRGR